MALPKVNVCFRSPAIPRIQINIKTAPVDPGSNAEPSLTDIHPIELLADAVRTRRDEDVIALSPRFSRFSINIQALAERLKFVDRLPGIKLNGNQGKLLMIVAITGRDFHVAIRSPASCRIIIDG